MMILMFLLMMISSEMKRMKKRTQRMKVMGQNLQRNVDVLKRYVSATSL